MDQTLIVAVTAAVASFLSGLLGIGGGLVLTPLLLYLPPAVGAPPLAVKLVTGLTIVQAISGSLFGLLRQRDYGNVSTRALRIMGPAMAFASFAGALVSGGTSDRVLLLVFAGLATLGAFALVVPVATQTAPVDELRINVPVALGIALFLGFFGGMVGIGGIAFIIPALIHLLRLPPRVAIGTSLGVGLVGALAALAGKAATAQVDPYLGGVVFLAALVVSPLGAAVSIRTPPRVLTSVLAAIVLLAAVRIAWTALAGT